MIWYGFPNDTVEEKADVMEDIFNAIFDEIPWSQDDDQTVEDVPHSASDDDESIDGRPSNETRSSNEDNSVTDRSSFMKDFLLQLLHKREDDPTDMDPTNGLDENGLATAQESEQEGPPTAPDENGEATLKAKELFPHLSTFQALDPLPSTSASGSGANTSRRVHPGPSSSNGSKIVRVKSKKRARDESLTDSDNPKPKKTKKNVLTVDSSDDEDLGRHGRRTAAKAGTKKRDALWKTRSRFQDDGVQRDPIPTRRSARHSEVHDLTRSSSRDHSSSSSNQEPSPPRVSRPTKRSPNARKRARQESIGSNHSPGPISGLAYDASGPLMSELTRDSCFYRETDTHLLARCQSMRFRPLTIPIKAVPSTYHHDKVITTKPAHHNSQPAVLLVGDDNEPGASVVMDGLLRNAKARGDQKPRNVDGLDAAVLKHIMDINRPSGCTNPVIDNNNDIKWALQYYMRMLEEITAHLNETCRDQETPPRPTYVNPDFIQSSPWHCVPPPSLMSVVANRYDGDPCDYDSGSERDISKIQTAVRMRTDPLFALWFNINWRLRTLLAVKAKLVDLSSVKDLLNFPVEAMTAIICREMRHTALLCSEAGRFITYNFCGKVLVNTLDLINTDLGVPPMVTIDGKRGYRWSPEHAMFLYTSDEKGTMNLLPVEDQPLHLAYAPKPGGKGKGEPPSKERLTVALHLKPAVAGLDMNFWTIGGSPLAPRPSPITNSRGCHSRDYDAMIQEGLPSLFYNPAVEDNIQMVSHPAGAILRKGPGYPGELTDSFRASLNGTPGNLLKISVCSGL